jgi:ComF family protein
LHYLGSMTDHSKKYFLNYLSGYWNDLISLWYPNLCASCNRNLVGNEQIICTHCKAALPLTSFHKIPGNAVEKVFWGKINFERASALLYFNKKGITQQLIHKLKYKGRTDIGEWLGRLIGHDLIDTYPFCDANYIVPVPLHHSKLRSRGYNQTDLLCNGMAEVLQIPIERRLLRRVRKNETQTHKSRLERWRNVDELFECHANGITENPRFLLVDDVITTGATLEACALALYDSFPGARINFVCGAFAHY